jgi:hypothetical protein
MRYIELLEYIEVDSTKFDQRVQQDTSFEQFKDAIGNSFPVWLEQFDPTQNNQYVNWMITRYMAGDITSLADLATLKDSLYKHSRLKATKKLKPEHADMGRIKDINAAMADAEYNNIDLSNKKKKKKSVEQKMYDDDDADLVYNKGDYKIVIPKTHEASCYFGINTKWCTTTRDSSANHDTYTAEGPLYAILEKSTNEKWQFHFESGELTDVDDKHINMKDWGDNHPLLIDFFNRLNGLVVNNDTVSYTLPDKSTEYHNFNGKLHREDGPAVEYADGTKENWINGKRIYPDGLHVDKYGDKVWYLHSRPHRTDGPAVELANGDKRWYLNGKAHREDGPAVEFTDGKKNWYLHGKRHSEEEFNQAMASTSNK